MPPGSVMGPESSSGYRGWQAQQSRGGVPQQGDGALKGIVRQLRRVGRFTIATEEHVCSELSEIATRVATRMSAAELCLVQDVLLAAIVRVEEHRRTLDAISTFRLLRRVCSAESGTQLGETLAAYVALRQSGQNRPQAPGRIAAIPMEALSSPAGSPASSLMHVKGSQEAGTTVAHRRVLRALTFIEDHYGVPTLDVETVADAAGLSRWHLERLLRKHLGASLGEYLRAFRMKSAMTLLDAGSLSVKEIAARVGYTSVSAFSRRFFHHTGTRPTEWRTRHARPDARSAVAEPSV